MSVSAPWNRGRRPEVDMLSTSLGAAANIVSKARATSRTSGFSKDFRIRTSCGHIQHKAAAR